jgi:hypothetical protein
MPRGLSSSPPQATITTGTATFFTTAVTPCSTTRRAASGGETTSYLYGMDGQRTGKTGGSVQTNHVRDLDGSLLATYQASTYYGLPREMWVRGNRS